MMGNQSSDFMLITFTAWLKIFDFFMDKINL